jgi:hypothetical protein
VPTLLFILPNGGCHHLFKNKGKKPSTGHICLAVSEASCNGGRKKKRKKILFVSFHFSFCEKRQVVSIFSREI